MKGAQPKLFQNLSFQIYFEMPDFEFGFILTENYAGLSFFELFSLLKYS